MASLENVQGANNSQDINLAGASPSNDPIQVGADALARGRAAGFTDDETLGVLSRRRRHQRPLRTDNREAAQAAQRFATITAADGTPMPQELERGVRSVPNDRVQFNLDGGERDQSVEDAYYGRDENEFSRYNKYTGEYEDVYVRDGLKTPDDLRDEAILRAYGIRKRKTGEEEVLDKRGRAVTNQQGEVMFRSTYDFENTTETTAGQGWQQGGGRAAAAAIERLDGKRTGSQFTEAEVAERLRRMYGDNIPAPVAAKLRENLRRTADPQQGKAVEAFFGRRAVQNSARNFSPAAKAISDARAARDASAAIVSGQAGVDEIEYLPGSLTRTYQDPDGGITIPTQMAEPDSIFGARPQAVVLNEDAVEIARALGDDVSAYVDVATGEGVEGITPSRLQTNLPNTSQQVNAPVTTAASWVAQNLSEGKTGDVLRDTNMSQITADFSRRVEANAPGYRSRPVRTVEDFATQIQRVIDARSKAGKNFYEPAFDEQGQPIRTKAGRQKQTKVTDPGIADVLRLLRMTSGEQGQLANALYSMGVAGANSRPVSSFSPGVTVNTGSMFGEKTDIGIAGRDTQRAAFARGRSEVFDEDEGYIDLTDAQRPQIGAVRERDEFGGVVREEPPLKRAVMKGRTPDEAVATYKAQRKKNNQPVDPVYAEKIRRENASLRADQAKLEEDRAVAKASEGHKRWDAPRAEAERNDREREASIRISEANEKAEIIKLMTKGATTSGGDVLGGDGPRPFITSTGRTVGVPGAGRKLTATWSQSPVEVKDGTSKTAPISWPRRESPGALVSLRQPAEPSGIRQIYDPGPDDKYDVEARFIRNTPSGGFKPEPTPADRAISNAAESRTKAKTADKRKALLDRLSTRNVRIGGGAAVGAGLLAALGINSSRQEEEQYR